MNKQEFYFDGMTNEELEMLYLKLQDAEDHERAAGSNVSRAAERMYMDCSTMTYEELMQRGEELRGILLLWKHELSNADTNVLLDLWRKLDKQRGEGSLLFTDEDYTECGDPISDRASVYDTLLWFLEVGLKEMKGIKVR